MTDFRIIGGSLLFEDVETTSEETIHGDTMSEWSTAAAATGCDKLFRCSCLVRQKEREIYEMRGVKRACFGLVLIQTTCNIEIHNIN